MPKTPSSRLFDLIKSLTRSEKRYFKLAAKADGESKYLQLFEAIEQQRVFDDAALRETVYGQQAIQSRKYSELKSYLYDTLLKQLQYYDEGNSIDYVLKRQLLSIRSLYRRQLFKDCTYQIRKSKQLALRYEHFIVLLELVAWEKQLAYARADIDYLDEHLQALLREEQQYLDELRHIRELEGLFYELYTLNRKNVRGDAAAAQRVQEIAQHPLLQAVPRSSLRAQLWHWRSRAALYYQQRDLEAFHHSNCRLIEFMEAHPTLRQEETTHYIAALSNYIAGCSYQQDYTAMRAGLDKLKQVKPASKDDEIKIHAQYYAGYFSLCIRTGDFKLGNTIMQRHLAESRKLDQQLFERSTFYFQYFYITFGNECYEEALNYLNQWLSLPRSVEQQDLQAVAKLLNLIVHYEMGNYMLLEYLLRSTQRSLRRYHGLDSLGRLMLQTIRQAIQAPDRSGRRAVFNKGNKQFQTLQLTEREHALLRFFDFQAWLESKAHELPFGQVLAQRKKN
ncbi:MAG: hypothetical protein D6772_17845 [Bacteroidetes bacterium]|nr:MAG: hypothetical protein D6772_17845 [Bacteroidota bacterium]